MNQNEVISKLRDLPESERPVFLKGLGFQDAQIPDFLNFVLNGKPEFIPAKPKEDRFPEMMARIKAKQEWARLNPPPPPPKEDLFQRDILLNQYLMGGSTAFDEASMHNPRFRKTAATSWLHEIFRLSRKRVALIIGDPGSGKTFATLAYMNSLTTVTASSGRVTDSDSYFVDSFELARMFRDERQYSDVLRRIYNVRHLMIDDLGTEPAGYKGGDFVSCFNDLFNQRHKLLRCMTFITCNAAKTDSNQKSPLEIYGDRFSSRFAEIGMFFQTPDPDFRKERSS